MHKSLCSCLLRGWFETTLLVKSIKLIVWFSLWLKLDGCLKEICGRNRMWREQKDGDWRTHSLDLLWACVSLIRAVLKGPRRSLPPAWKSTSDRHTHWKHTSPDTDTPTYTKQTDRCVPQLLRLIFLVHIKHHFYYDVKRLKRFTLHLHTSDEKQ